MTEQADYAQVNDRLKEISSLVEDENLPLDEALGLFEEAVALGMKASSLLETDIADRSSDEDDQQAVGPAVSSADPEAVPAQDEA